MILILNDTAHCWENETSVAASPFECPCEFIKSTSFPVPTQICTAAWVWKNIQGQKSIMYCMQQNAVSLSGLSITVYDNESSPNIPNVKEDYFLLDVFFFKAFPLYR